MQKKGSKSPASSLSADVNMTDKSNKHDNEKREAVESRIKTSPTTDRPIITVIKAEDLIEDNQKSHEITIDEDDDDEEEEDDDSVTVQESNPSSNPFTLPSPFKNLPNVSVCLKEEDRVPFVRELKGVKRSPSTGSNSSTGSSDAQKSSLFVKRRKVEKPAPVVIGRQNDCYCWVCHRENISLVCIACPRAYHFKCAGESGPITSDWVCPECQRILAAENVDSRSSTLAEISLDKLAALLKLSLNKMKQRAPIAFHQAVSLEHYPLYPHYVIHPMDFSLLEKNIKLKVYGCTEAFLADVKWISHNSCVFNGTQHPLSTNAKNLVKSCDQDMQEIEVCPDCFVHSVVRNKYWFSEVCRKPHPLVWAKLKGFPYWPAKVVRIADGNVDARFFGAHDRAWVPISQCYHLSKEMPTSSKPKKKGNYEVALDELNVHVHLLIQKFGCFEYAPYRTSFNPENKDHMYHGIDVDKACKEEIAIDNSFSQAEINSLSFEKESRFASFFESEYERSSADETKLSETQSDTQPNTPLIKNGIESPFSFFKHRNSEDSVISDREATSKQLCSIDQLKSTSETKSGGELKSIEGAKNSVEVKKTTVSDLPSGEPEKASNSSQLSKLQLALERIKGYVSLSVDNEKENDEIHNRETNIEVGDDKAENISEKEKENVTKNSKNLSPQKINETVTLPLIESNNISEKVEDVGKALEVTKKKDSFFLKLNETIESCKAKLGISDINDDLSSDESGEENASKSDEEDNDEKDDTSVSEEGEASEDEEEAELMEVSGEEDENEDNESKSEEESDDEDDESTAEEVSEDSDENQDPETSDTDIVCSSVLSPKKNDKVNLRGADKIDSSANNITIDKSSKEVCSDSNEAIITNPDMQVPEVTISVSNTLETATDNSSSESSNDVRGNSDSSSSNQVNKSGTVISSMSSKDTNIHSVPNDSNDSVSGDIKDKASDVNKFQDKEKQDLSVITDNIKSNSPQKSIENNLLNVNSAPPAMHGKPSKEDLPVNIKESDQVEKASDPSMNEAVDDDDEIYICTPTRPKSPPVIVLDDDQENDNSSVSDTYAIKSPPFSTSVDSFSSVDNVASMPPSNGEAAAHEKSVNAGVSNENVNEEVLNSNEINEKNVCNDSGGLKKAAEKRKRQSSFDSSSDDEIQIVTPSSKKTILTGAIRTFNKPTNNQSSLKPSTPTMETVKRNLAKESLNQEIQSPTSSTEKDLVVSPNKFAFVSDQILAPQTTINPLRTAVIDTSKLTEKDKEVIALKSKLNCVYTAYQIQSWKCTQEREELRHNMNLIIMELRSCLESDKKQTIEALSKKFEQEKLKSIEETKRKQWCANCLMESRYACCWNTSYCSTDCQKHHFPEHRKSCTQLRSKNLEISDMKQKSTSANFSENNENKKLIIVNMKSSDSTQQVSVSKPQTVQVMTSKTVSLQNTATSLSNSNIQFVLAPIKSSNESTIINTTTTASTREPSQSDSTQILNGVAISLLKKKNVEPMSLGMISTLEEKKLTEIKNKNETALEEIYFPSPPRVTFEGYETATPDPSVVILEGEEIKDDCDTGPSDSDLPADVPAEPDLVLSDTDDRDNEMVCIGHGVDIKAKFLNKCLVYGRTAKKLTRCLVDVIFPDIKLLASCSAFGQKSHVTKFTRAALPTRKVHAIIDYVRKRFPDSTRSEIVLAINMKCKEARVVISRKDYMMFNESTSKGMFWRKLAREKKSEFASPSTTTVSATTVSSPAITPSVAPSSIAVIASPVNKSAPNVVCVKSKNPNVLPFSMSTNAPQGPNILRCNTTQILIKPKAMLDSVGSPAILQTQVPPTKKRETVKELLAANKTNPSGKMPNEGGKLVMTVDTRKQNTSHLQPIAPAPSIRPYIIIGSQMGAVRPSLTIQNPTLPAQTPVNK